MEVPANFVKPVLHQLAKTHSVEEQERRRQRKMMDEARKISFSKEAKEAAEAKRARKCAKRLAVRDRVLNQNTEVKS
jgi:hypothetical protein